MTGIGGNEKSGFPLDVPAVACGFPADYYPYHAPLGFPNCANYKGTEQQRIADLRNRGYGEGVVIAWKKYYEDKKTAVRVDTILKGRISALGAVEKIKEQSKVDESEKLLQIQLENQRIQNEIKRKEMQESFTKQLEEIKKQIPIIEPEIIPTVVASSALIPLGIIGLLLYSSMGKK